MSPSVKVFATLSLSAAVGEKIKRTGDTRNIRGAGTALKVASFNSAMAYPYPTFKPKQIKAIGTAVENLVSTPMEPQEILSMLIAGLVDIRAKCKASRHELIDAVITPAQTCLDFYPGEIDHEAAYERYMRWAS